MFADVATILSQHGNTIVEQIRQNLASTGTNATGRTSRSLRFEVTNDDHSTTLRIIGKSFFNIVETGRKATPEFTKPSKQFVAAIVEWLKAKTSFRVDFERGPSLQGLAYGIAKSIHQKGTKLNQSGGRTDIISNVINETLVESISKSVLDQFTNEYLKNVVKFASSGNNIN